jgi:hypothetical protein
MLVSFFLGCFSPRPFRPPRYHRQIYYDRINYETDTENLFIKVETRLAPEKYEIYYSRGYYDGISLFFQDGDVKATLRLSDRTGYSFLQICNSLEIRSREISNDESFIKILFEGKYFILKIEKKLFENELINYDNQKIFDIPLHIKGKGFYDYSKELSDFERGKNYERVYEIYKGNY